MSDSSHLAAFKAGMEYSARIADEVAKLAVACGNVEADEAFRDFARVVREAKQDTVFTDLPISDTVQ